MALDFEAEGLLEGLDDPAARRARRELLARLHDDGVPLAELRAAVEHDRLALLPAERLLAPAARWSVHDVAERTGVEADFVLAILQAQGTARPDPDEIAFGELEVATMRVIDQVRASGYSDAAILEIARVLGSGMAQLAATLQSVVAETLMRPGDTEQDLAIRYEQAAREIAPHLGLLMTQALSLHLRERLRQAAVSQADLDAGRTGGVRRMGIAFADLVGFTRLGERLPPEDLAPVVGRFGVLAAELTRPPTTLVKTIGDAVMLASPEAEPLLATTLELVAAAEAEGEEFPQLRAGLALGDALGRWGDWYGQPVNLASRITAIARPGSVLADERIREAAGDGFRWSFAGKRKVKGVRDEVRLFRARAAAGDGD